MIVYKKGGDIMDNYAIVVSGNKIKDIDEIRKYVKHNYKNCNITDSIERYYFKQMFDDIITGSDLEISESKYNDIYEEFINDEEYWENIDDTLFRFLVSYNGEQKDGE